MRKIENCEARVKLTEEYELVVRYLIFSRKVSFQLIKNDTITAFFLCETTLSSEEFWNNLYRAAYGCSIARQTLYDKCDELTLKMDCPEAREGNLFTLGEVVCGLFDYRTPLKNAIESQVFEEEEKTFEILGKKWRAVDGRPVGYKAILVLEEVE